MSKSLSELIKNESLRIKQSQDKLEENQYDSENGSEWIVAVDKWGFVTILKTPNIHYSYLEFTNAEEIGLPFEVDPKETKPGVYKWTCDWYGSTDWETGYLDDYGFEVIKEEFLWSYNEN